MKAGADSFYFISVHYILFLLLCVHL